MTNSITESRFRVPNLVEEDANYAFSLDGEIIKDGFDTHLEALRALMVHVAGMPDIAFKGWHEANVRLWNSKDECWDIEHEIENSMEV